MSDASYGGRTAPTRPRGRLARYALYQAWDYFRERGLGIIVIGALIGYQALALVKRTGLDMSSGMGASAASSGVAMLAVQVAPLFVLLSVSRIISADRTMGYYRMVFSKPINVPLYYLQRFAVHLVGVLACVAALYGLLWLGGLRASVVPVLAYVATLYVAMGGLGFMLSAITRFDWPLLVGTWYASALMYSLYGERPGVVGALVHLLPPANAAGDLRTAMSGGATFPHVPLLWLLGYGLACTVVGLVVLERRPLAQ